MNPMHRASQTFPAVGPSHPLEREVMDLLRTTRASAQRLWDRVAAHNEQHPPDPDESVRVTFYVGQAVDETESLES